MAWLSCVCDRTGFTAKDAVLLCFDRSLQVSLIVRKTIKLMLFFKRPPDVLGWENCPCCINHQRGCTGTTGHPDETCAGRSTSQSRLSGKWGAAVMPRQRGKSATLFFSPLPHLNSVRSRDPPTPPPNGQSWPPSSSLPPLGQLTFNLGGSRAIIWRTEWTI